MQLSESGKSLTNSWIFPKTLVARRESTNGRVPRGEVSRERTSTHKLVI